VDDAGLLEAIFPDERSRPCLRWLSKMRKKGFIPCVKIGARFVRFSVCDVEASLKRKFEIPAKF